MGPKWKPSQKADYVQALTTMGGRTNSTSFGLILEGVWTLLKGSFLLVRGGVTAAMDNVWR